MKTILLRYLWGIVALGIYLLLVGLLLFYFNYRTHEQKKHYVKKDEHRIQVGLSAPAKTKAKKPSVSHSKPHSFKRANKIPQKSEPKRDTRKQILKEKVVKKKVSKKIPKKKVEKKQAKRKKVTHTKKPKDLFKNLKTEKKPLIKMTDKPIKSKPTKPLFKMTEKRPSAGKRIRDSLKEQRNRDSGVEDSYLAHVQEMLEGWPAQSDFAGEKVKVHLKIDPTGHFKFVIKRKSRNPEFNRALTEYLEQLQEFGFGPHKGARTYLFEAKFVAKE